MVQELRYLKGINADGTCRVGWTIGAFIVNAYDVNQYLFGNASVFVGNRSAVRFVNLQLPDSGLEHSGGGRSFLFVVARIVNDCSSQINRFIAQNLNNNVR